ncbi:MAG: HAD family hydrolase [Actinomyces sp.]|nr:MAG: HAD family hydrolase [Actinomyces sp.]
MSPSPVGRSGGRRPPLASGGVIRAALFDFGGVITTSPFEAFNRYEDEAGLARDTIRRINATDPDTNAWARLERGELDREGFVRAFEEEARRLGHRVDGRRVLECLQGAVRPEMVTAVERCRERLATGLLTNNFRDPTGTRPPEIEEVMGHFDVVVESSVVGVRKPDPRFYEIACERLGVPPEACVFCDDLGVNLKPARAMGMTTIKVEDPRVALAELEAVVGFPLT